MAGDQRWYSERFRPTGASFAGGVRNALGRPRLNAHTVLVRETVQNSWDARKSDDETVDFSLEVSYMGPPHLATLRSYVLDTVPHRLGLWTSLKKPVLPVLLVSDRGTRGLGGPTTADQSSETRSDFADFFFNVGRAAERTVGGGTYGFGKSVLYLASAARSILAYSRCFWNGHYESRLMGAALGDDYVDNVEGVATNLTGRHWWGVVSEEEDAVRPVTGVTADALAAALGFPLMSGSHTGTTIMVIDFATEGDQALSSAAVDLAWALTWNCWPKTMTRGESKTAPMCFSVTCNGAVVAVPSTESVPALRAFGRCLDRVRGTERDLDDVELISIDCKAPRKHLGLLAYCTYRSGVADDSVASASPIALPAHHVALMRSPELVVRYSEQTALPANGVGWAAVFEADPEVDDSFARSEPPTHDDWVLQQIEKREDRTFVRVALERIRDAINQRTLTPIAGPEATSQGSPLQLADLLSGLVAGTSGGKAAPAHGNTRGPSARTGGSRAGVELLGPMRLELHDGLRFGVIPFAVHHARGSRGTRVEASVGVLVQDGSLERDPPFGGTSPGVAGWSADDGEIQPPSDTVETLADDGRVWELRILIPDDVAVAADLHAFSLEPL